MTPNQQTFSTDTWFSRGLAAQDRDDPAAAINAYLKVVQSDRQHFAATYNLATLYHHTNQLESARRFYITAIRLNPASALPYKGLGDIFFNLNDIDRAAVIYEQALKIAPDFPEAWHNLGLAELHRQNFSGAYRAYHQAVTVRPNYKSALEALVKLESITGQTSKTVDFLSRLNQTSPQNPLLKLALAEIFHNHHQSEKALNLIRDAISIDKNSGAAFNLLALIQLRLGEAESARLNFQRAHNLALDSLRIHSNFLYSLLTDPLSTPESYRHQADLWWRRQGAPAAAETVLSHQRSLETNRPLHLGFISGDLHRHSISFFLLTLLKELPDKGFSIYCYSDSLKSDDYTAAIKGKSQHWRSIYGLSCEVVAKMIATDQIDVLVELSGHTANNRLPVIARKPAPVQFSWLGYPASTGIANGTFRLTDKLTDPENFQEHYSEPLAYIRTPFLCYTPPEALNLVPEKRTTPDHIVFASFNNVAKINREVIETWARILILVPGARLLLKSRTIKDITTSTHLKNSFSKHGVEPERIIILADNSTTADHFTTYNRVDIALDSFPYNGTTTTCDALWMGTPVITLRGEAHAGRVGATLMQSLGCPELTAKDITDYINKAVSLAGDTTRLRNYHTQIRSLMQKSPLMNGPEFAEDFRRVITDKWHQWRNQRITLLQQLILGHQEILHLPAGTEKLLPVNRAAYELFVKSFNRSDAPYLWLKLGQRYSNDQEWDLACECFREAVALDYDNSTAHFTQALTLQNLERDDEALQHYRKALALDPQSTHSAINLSNLLLKQNRSREALAVMLEIQQAFPDDNDVNLQLANIYYDLNRLEDACRSLNSCIKLQPKQASIWNNLGYLLSESGKSDRAAECYRKALSLDPDLVAAQTNLTWNLTQTCDWKELKIYCNRAKSLSPLVSIIIGDSPEANLKCARTELRKKLTKETFYMSRTDRKKTRQHNIIRIGYLSSDFRDHPVAHNLLNLFRLHDRTQFHITAYSCGRNDGSHYRQQIKDDCDSFVDLQEISDYDCAHKIHSDKIDILIELMGHTRNDRLGICAFKPAPVQISYLGYPGTTGADFIDYLIADKTVIPPREQIHYSEKIIYLPDCFMVADRSPIGPQPQRSDCDLPPTGSIFCSFNSPFKIEPVMFKVWMDILQALPDAHLWLREGSKRYEDNLKLEAQKHKIDPQRLIFASRTDKKEDHLARLQLADLALDTRIYNGHTTTLDALWAGVPVLTTSGFHFASRVSDSNLKVIGLDEMITENLDAYRKTAIELGQHPEKLQKIKEKLNRNRLTSPLFNTAATVKNLETAYLEIWHSRLQPDP